MKKEQFDRMQEEIEEKKPVAIAAEKEQAYEKNSTARVVEKAIKQIEELGEQLEGLRRRYYTSIIILSTVKETAAVSTI
jgi:hypothetical protein